ncbi:flagellar hook-length control protein FliK [Duganella qianjiadongensis]|uniref:Flagellar hook-length control protein FliK n=1 Tax=Duganella qianjiadongensis TaxID=2692176 RepID=A0ABW9VFN2_9BURK|nr:flagellar hook-length control protein FliK [Duganella qianjiadongensis]MYM38413.1 flagellar hook-length control protein FliK [Duganella qianjiadongensis]
MLPSPLTITPVGAVTAAGPAVAIGDGRQAAFQRALQSLVGQSVTGEVLSRFSDGSFMVNVAEHAVRMQLPADASVGSRLPLTVLSAEPRATFELNQPSSSVVLYGEAHTPAGTGDLYSPGTAGSGAAAPAAAGAGTASAVGNGTASATASTGPNTGASSASNAAALAAQAEFGAAGQPALAGSAALPAAAAGTAAQLAAAAGYPALAAGVSLNGAPASRSNSASHALLPASEDEAAGTNSPRPAGANAGHATAGVNTASQTGRTHSAAASLLGKAPLTPVAELPGLDAGTSQPELSTAARILGSVLSQPAAASALPLLGKTALFSQGAPEPAQLAQTLQSTIEDSGLFYESHVAAWSRGERTLEQLQREPQMQQARASSASSAAAEAASLPDRSAAQQINQQLLAHEQGRVQWQGEAWPGQPMQWEIQRQSERQPRGQSPAGQEPTAVWRSSLRLRFAALGELSATITMVGQQVHLQLQTDDAASGATLRAQADVLEQSMAAAGIALSSCNIQHGPAHEG